MCRRPSWSGSREVSDPEQIARRYRQFAERECKGYSVHYYRLALDVAEEDEVIGFLAGLPVTQPNLFFAAIQLLTGPARMPRTGSEVRALLKTRGGDVAGVMRSRRTQTNEVGRCAVLLPALPPGRLALLEVGASAGLCLLLDQYSYELGSTRIGDAASPVHVRCDVAGRVPIPRTLPEVAWRRGLDLHPVDIRDDGEVGWLLACVWPDHPERRQRLEAAITVARRGLPVVTTGDLVDDLPGVLAEVPDDVDLVVFHSAVLSYVSPDRRRAFVEVLARVSEQRDVVWLSNEAPGVVPDAEHAVLPRADDMRFHLVRTRFSKSRRHDELLALAHPHGAELTWL